MQFQQALSKDNQQKTNILLDQLQEQPQYIQLILSGFPQSTQLESVKKNMSEEYPFISFIEVLNPESIVCYFQSMTDLIQIDQGRKYGAMKAYIKNEFTKMAQVITKRQSQLSSLTITEVEEQYQTQAQTPQMSKKHGQTPQKQFSFKQMASFKFIPSPSYINKNGIKSLHADNLPKLERLTSLEDQLKQIQLLHEHFDVFKESQNEGSGTFFCYNKQKNGRKLSEVSTQQNSTFGHINLNQYKQNGKDQQQKKKECDIIKPFMEGVLLTTFIWGGIKLARYIFKGN